MPATAERTGGKQSVVVAGRLREARRTLGWTLADAAERSGGRFKLSILGAYERGTRQASIDALYDLAALYRVPVHALLPTDSKSTSAATEVVDRLAALPAPRRRAVEQLIQQLASELQTPSPAAPPRGRTPKGPPRG